MPSATITNDAIADQAHCVATAHHAVRKATAAHASAQADSQIIHDRVEAIEGQRAAIISRRQRGEARPGDAGEIELLTADRQGLESIQAERDAAVIKAQAVMTAARQALAATQGEMQRAENGVERALLTEHLGKLDALMLSTLDQLNEVNGRFGEVRPTWAPSQALFRELRKIAAKTGML